MSEISGSQPDASGGSADLPTVGTLHSDMLMFLMTDVSLTIIRSIVLNTTISITILYSQSLLPGVTAPR